ncbi:MAG: homoserine dehydrogenase [Anaerolineae bacterium]|nr:homoserine dehydrogenase [Anaerolineae bacterium]
MLRLALIGFGTVGQGFAEILQASAESLAAQQGVRLSIVAVSDLIKGAVYHPDGLDVAALLNAGKSGSLSAYPDQPGLVRGQDSLATIRQSNADVVVEVSYTDLKTGEPAISHVKAAFEVGKHAILTNKGPVALAYSELSKLAAHKRLFFGYEGTVMSGTPSLRLARTALAGCTIREARGILNGTTNYILMQMERGMSYADALTDAQRLGYAEADPTGDVEGFDAAGKLVILANVAFGASLRMDDVDRTGITKLTIDDIESARASGERWKLIACAQRTDHGVTASVKPTRLPVSDPLAGVDGATNAITYETDLLGSVTLVGPGAGRKETGFAILSDLLELAHGL